VAEPAPSFSAAALADPQFLRIDAVDKTYGTDRRAVEALRRIDLSVPQGEFVSLLGPSGCGKSTLMAMIAGLDPPSGGQITLKGAAVTGPRFSNGIVFQDATLMPWSPVIDNVLLPIRIKKLARKDYVDKAMDLLRAVGLDGFEARLPRQLSGGMRQRVALCRALIHDPDLLLMDEPFSALDAITRDDMAVLLLDLWERVRKTVVFVTHSIREAVLLSDRVVVFSARPGRIMRDVVVPFARPRDFALTETPAFNALCADLRAAIHAGTGRAAA